MPSDLWHEGRERAERILLANGGPLGLQGGSTAYKQVWARDSMICGLGLLACGEEGAAATEVLAQIMAAKDATDAS